MGLNSNTPGWLVKAASIIESDIRKHFSIEEIALKAGTNSYSLKREFRKIYGVGVYEYLVEARMKKARELLSETDQPVKQICRMVGYKSASSFIAVFKKNTGFTPLEWRHREREKF